MRATAFLAGLLLAGGTALHAEVEVRVTGGRVDVKANAAPLGEILDRLSRQIGMKIVNDGVTPHLLLTLSLENRTPVEAVLGVMEGLGLNYAMLMDASGTRIETLVMAGVPSPGARPPGGGATPPPRQFVPERVVPPPAAGPDEEDVPVEDAPDEDAQAEEETVPGKAGAEAGVPGATPPNGPMPYQPEQMFPASPFTPRPPVFTPGQPPGTPNPGTEKPPEEKPKL